MTRPSPLRHRGGPAGRPFLKMNGLGNDFVVLDARRAPLALASGEARAIADRRGGIGCDQIILLEPSRVADLRMRILNADGSASGACGNATRCVARLLMDETGDAAARIETDAGVLLGENAGAWNRVRVDMGRPRLGWADVPLAGEGGSTVDVRLDGLALPPGMPDRFGAVSMGNPHAVFFVDDPAVMPLAVIGPAIECHPLFPERVNVSVAAVRARDEIDLRVWERGAGLTRACGTAACATLVAARRAGLSERAATVRLPGGALEIAWAENDHVLMTGAIEREFEGVLAPSLFESTATAET